MDYRLNGKYIEAAPGERYMKAAMEHFGEIRPLAVQVGGETLELTEPVQPGAEAKIITYETNEGRLIYERSLRFIFLLAIKQLYPDRRVRLEHSLGNGVYAVITGGTALTPQMVHRIEDRMREIANQDLPFEKHSMSKAEAVAHFEATGQYDKVELLKYRPYEYFQLYSLGEMKEYFYGAMAPSTGFLNVFALRYHMPGVVLQLPDPEDPSRVAPFFDVPKLMKTFAQSAKWNEILDCSNAADLNRMVSGRQLREFIRVNEALHEKSIAAIADQFAESGARLILIAGPSSSGKTTFSHRLSIALKVLGLRPMAISLDDYYIDREKIPYDENGEQDLERLDTLDVDLFNEHLVRILHGEKVETPIYDFHTGKRTGRTHTVQADIDQPIIIEGIHGLNDELTREVERSLKFKIYISALTTLNLDDHNRIRTTDARLLRRMVRDYQFRGTTPETTMSMWPSVRRGEEKYIFPFQEEADVMFNSSLAYEMAIMKKYIYPILINLPPDSPHYTMARRLVKFLNYFQSSDVEDEIPINSILREFIGGCCFYRKDD
ncbi:MAG: nucleoside kinase [Clostridia bacterium]|nr:nucleoside kinase [Clostridia bacterium]